MKSKTVSGIMLALLLVGMLMLAFGFQSVEPEQKTWTVDGARFKDLEIQGAKAALLSSNDDWAMFRHDPSHTGYSASTAPNTNNTIWTYTTGYWVESSPAVADSKVYIGSYDNKVYCLDALTGAYIWNYTTGDMVRSSPAVADGKVYIGSQDYNFYCLNASTGALIWNYATGWTVGSSPAVADGKVYIGSRDNNVYCLDALTGALIWNYTTGGEVWSSPAVADGKVYVGSSDYNVYCLNASTGAYIWSYITVFHPVWSSPAVADGKVYVGSSDCNVYCLNASAVSMTPDERKIWNYTTGGYVGSSPAVADSKVYIGSIGDNKVYCLDALTGALIWNYTTGGGGKSSPAVADGKVYIGSFDMKVYCLNASTGEHIWNYTTGNPVESSPAVADGKVYIGSWDGKLYAFGVIRDVAVTNVTSSKTVVGQGYSMFIYVAVENQGDFTETNIGVTAYANETAIQSLIIPNLAPGANTTVTFTWNTTGFAKGNYTISAYATRVLDETDTADNTLTDGVVTVACPGDITGSTPNVPDSTVNMRDISLVAKGFGANLVTDPASPKWGEYWHETPCDSCPHSANCDLTGPTLGLPDDTINMRDISLVASLFGTGGC